MFDIIYTLEMIGVVAFAISGMIVARSKNMDPVGVFAIGFITALGGGTLRDLIMDNHPLYWIKHQEQPIMILAMAIVFSYWSRAHSLKESRIVFPDAIGLGIFFHSRCATGSRSGPLLVYRFHAGCNDRLLRRRPA